jgi:hypothetical protein
MRIDGESASRKMTSRSTEHPQMDLQRFTVGDCVSFEQIVNGSIIGHERKAV